LAPSSPVLSEVLRAEGASPARSHHCVRKRCVVSSLEQDLGQNWNLKEPDIGAFEHLAWMAADVLRSCRPVRRIDHYQLFNAAWIADRYPATHDATPVVADKRCAITLAGCDEPDYIRRELVQMVCCNARRLAAEVVSALVRSEDANSRFGERIDVVPPSPPKLWKSMQKYCERAGFWSGFDGVQCDI